MPRTCQNCEVGKGCFFRGITNPCEDHVTNRMHADLRRKAKAIKGKPMTMKEGQFVEGSTTSEFFTPKQAGWLRSIVARFAI